MKKFNAIYPFNNRSPLLNSYSQIIFDTYSSEIRWALFGIFAGNIGVFLLLFMFASEPAVYQFINQIILITVHLIIVLIMFFRPTIRNFAFSYASSLLTIILMCLWNLITDYEYSSQYILLFAVPYLALGALSISIIPNIVKTLIPLFILTILMLFIFHIDESNLQFSLLMLLAFIGNAFAILFFLLVIISTNKRITRLAEKQRAQLEELSFTEGLLNFAIAETKQTIIFQDDGDVLQNPSHNQFTEIAKGIEKDADLNTSLISSLLQNGYEKLRLEDYTTATSSSTLLFRDKYDHIFSTTFSVTPSGADAILITDISGLAHSSTLLNAALNGINIGVLCYNESGWLIMSRGAALSNINSDLLKSYSKLNSKILNNNSRLSQFKIGEKYYDISVMKYGSNIFVTHEDVTARHRK